MVYDDSNNQFRSQPKLSPKYKEMVKILPENYDYSYDKNYYDKVFDESDLSVLSNAVEEVIKNDSNMKITHFTRKYVDDNHSKLAGLTNNENCYNLNCNIKNYYEQALSEMYCELEKSKELIFKNQVELLTCKDEIDKKDLKIDDMEDKLYKALDKMIEFIVKYENAIICN